MHELYRAADRGHADHGWLDTWHTFSFSSYYDPARMGFRALRVINEDWVQPEQGFGLHPHRDMEIVTYVLKGELQHRDDLGNGSVIRAGELQRMTAGTGIEHSEFNPSTTAPVHLYQIWLKPREKGLPPSYEQRGFSAAEKSGRLKLVASSDGAEQSMVIQQDARLFLGLLKEGESRTCPIAPGRHLWLQVLRGSVRSGEQRLRAGDALAVSDEQVLAFTAQSDGEVLLFDLA